MPTLLEEGLEMLVERGRERLEMLKEIGRELEDAHCSRGEIYDDRRERKRGW